MRATSGSTCRAQLTDFEVLYRAHAGYVWTVLSRLGVESVADAHQEVFLTAYRRLDTFDGDRPVRPWLVGIARRVAFRHRRGQQRRSRKRDALAELTHGAHESRGRIEASDFLAQFLEGLTPLRRTIFLRGELEGRTGREIAEALQLSPSTVSSHLRAARAQLRAELLAVEGARPSRAQVDRRFALLAGHLPAVASKPWLATLGAMKLVATAAAVTAAAAVAVTAVPSREGEPPAVVASSDAPTDGEEPERRRNGDAMSASPPPTKDAPDPRA
ncbi:MAG: sigma-70 family RNA polymerase sigma factor, partial [Myxococcota bacterium]